MEIKPHPYTVWLIAVVLAFTSQFKAQETLTPLSSNIQYQYTELQPTAQQQEISNYSQRAPSLFLPFLDDFHYADRLIYPDATLWQDNNVYVNQGFPINPPSIGVATFDGLNAQGYPYNTSLNPNLSTNGPADVLTSRPINLLVGSISQTYTPNDSIGLSFYYQARGNGETPELIDSLILDFFNPSSQKWDSRIWFSKGNNNPNTKDTVFKRAFVMIKDSAYFKDGFQFRFRNKATASGNFDHWHLDYVYLNSARDTKGDTLYNDVTFGYVPTSFLRDYNAMPYEQYNTGEMSKSNKVLLRNSYSSAINIFYENRFYDATQQVYAYSAQANNITPYRTNGYYNNNAFANPASHPSFTYAYPNALSDSVDFRIKHYVYRSGANADFITANDTVVQYQRFRNYYACDDGSAEAGYYVLGAAGQMAQRFRVNVTDTLQALRIYFDPAPLGSTSKFYFRIKLYSGNNLPGNLIYTSDTLYPKFKNTGFKGMPEYAIKPAMVLNPGTYFIGIQQQLATGLVVGFDANTETNGAVVYNSGSGWNTSTFKGALMIRPVMGRKVFPPVGISETTSLANRVNVFPNPATNQFTVENSTETILQYSLKNQLGQVLRSGELQTGANTIYCEDLATGLYLLSVSDAANLPANYKILLTH